jgi:hypothetical protein
MKSFRSFIEEMRLQERVWFRDDIVDLTLRQHKLDALKARMKQKRQQQTNNSDDTEHSYVDIPE